MFVGEVCVFVLVVIGFGIDVDMFGEVLGVVEGIVDIMECCDVEFWECCVVVDWCVVFVFLL